MAARGGWGTGLHLAAGLGVLGAAGYAFVAVVGHAFGDPRDAAVVSALISLYLLINIVGPGVFAALEQETSRAVSAAVARNEAVRPVVRRAAVLAARYAAGAVAVVAVAWPLGLDAVLDGRVGLLGALLVAVVGSAGVYWVRGILAGRQQFVGYALTLYLEGSARLLPGLVLLVLAVRDPTAFGLAFAIGSVLAALLLLPAVRSGPGPGPGASSPAGAPAGMGRAVSLLFLATGLGQLVANLAPVVVTFRLADAPVVASVFAATFVLARIPLFLFVPVQAVLLPKLTSAATHRDRDLLVRRLSQVLGAVLGVGVLGLVAGVLVGPDVAELLFNTALRPGRGLLAALGAATVLMMLALVLQPALIALDRQRDVGVGWVLGAVVFLVVLWAPVDPLTAALVAQVAGPLVVVIFEGCRLWAVLRTGAPPTAGSDPHGRRGVGWPAQAKLGDL